MNLPSTSLWGVYLVNNHPSITVLYIYIQSTLSFIMCTEQHWHPLWELLRPSKLVQTFRVSPQVGLILVLKGCLWL